MATERKTERAIIETRILRDDAGVATGVEFDVLGHYPFTVRAADLTDELRAEALCHGIKQKIGDAAAIAKNRETGRSATPADKHAAMAEVVERLHEGEWNKRGQGDGTGPRGLLAQALDRLYAGKLTPEQVDAYLATQDDKAQARARKDARIAPIIEQIKAERAAKRPAAKPTETVDNMLEQLDKLAG